MVSLMYHSFHLCSVYGADSWGVVLSVGTTVPSSVAPVWMGVWASGPLIGGEVLHLTRL